MRRKAWALFMVICGAALAASGFAGTSHALSNATAPNLAIVGIYDGDWIYNYDFSSQDAVQGNVDWAVSILFWNHADINWVKTQLNGVYSGSGGPEYHRGNDQWGSIPYVYWDQDSGKKQSPCTQNTWLRHYRVYAYPANDYNYNTGWGTYIVGTQHYDINDGCGSNPASGYSETSDGVLAGDAAAVWGSSAVNQDWFAANTAEPTYRYEVTSNGYGHHWDQSEGNATIVNVP